MFRGEHSVQYSLSRATLAASKPDHTAGKQPETHLYTEDETLSLENLHTSIFDTLSHLSTPHTLPLNIHPPHLHHLLEPKLPINRPQLIIVAIETELNTMVSDVAHDVVFARADFMQDVGRAGRDVADGGGDGVRAANADGLIHVAHGGLACVWVCVCVCVWDGFSWERGRV